MLSSLNGCSVRFENVCTVPGGTRTNDLAKFDDLFAELHCKRSLEHEEHVEGLAVHMGLSATVKAFQATLRHRLRHGLPAIRACRDQCRAQLRKKQLAT